MLADQTPAAGQSEVHDPTEGRERPQRERRRRIGRVLVFAGAVGLVLIYALRGGGSYDIVVFEQNGLIIWWVLAIGVALGLLPRRRPSREFLLLLAALGAYAAWTALSLTWTTSSELTTEELSRALDYLGLVALLGFVLDRNTWRSAAAGAGLGAMLVCVVALGSRLAPSVFGTDHVAAVLHIDRLSVPFGYWNAVAAWAAMCTALGLAWSAHGSSRVGRAVALALVPVAALTAYLTYSRAAVGGVVLGLIAVLGVSRNRLTVLTHAAVAAAGSGLAVLAVRGAPQIARATGTHGVATVLGALIFAAAACLLTAVVTSRGSVERWRLSRRMARPLTTACALAVLLLGTVLGPKLVTNAWQSFTRAPSVQSSTDPTARLSNLSGTRYPLWKSALEAFQAHPVGGIGAGTIEFWWNQHATNSEFVRDAHNIWLENMAELGAPGLLLIVAVAGSAIALCLAVRRRARRSVSAGAAAGCFAAFAVYLLHATVDWMWESTAVTALALGGVAIVGARTSEGRVELRLPARGVLALVAAIAALVQLPGLLSTAAIRHSQSAERVGNASLALAWAKSAVGTEPWSASAYEQRALVLEAGGRLSQAAEDLKRATSHEPNNYQHWLLLSRVETELGHLDAAVVDYDRAHRLRPLGSVFAFAP